MSDCAIDAFVLTLLGFAAGVLTLRLLYDRRLEAGRRDVLRRLRPREDHQ